MKCVRCEIIRAKLESILLWNFGYSLPEICDSLNAAYSGTYAATQTGMIVRYPEGVNSEAFTVIFGKAEPNLNDVV